MESAMKNNREISVGLSLAAIVLVGAGAALATAGCVIGNIMSG